MASPAVVNNGPKNDPTTPNKNKRGRKRKRTVSELKVWTDVFTKIASDLKNNDPIETPADFDIPPDLWNAESENSFNSDPYDAEKIRNNPRIARFNEEIKNMVNSVSVPDMEVYLTVKKIINDLEKTVRNQVPEHQWHYFGSYLNGLGSRDSDIDLYYQSLVDTPFEMPKKIEKLIRRNSRLFSNILFIKRARIPLIKLVHVDTGKELDISFSSEMGVRNSKLTKLYLTLNPHVKSLTLYLKHVLKKYDLQGTCKITTYILSWLVIYFMQKKSLLPPVIDIRKAVKEKYDVLGWDCRVPETFSYSTKDPGCLYLLLRDFLRFYSDFNFLKYVICPYLACCFPISDFENLQIPNDAFSTYLKKKRENQVNSFSRHVMNLQDPSDLGFNLARQVDITVVNKFKMFCYYVYRLLPDCSSKISKGNPPLGKILPVRLPNENYQPKNLMQFVSTHLDISSLPENSLSRFKQNGIKFVLEAVRKMMEIVFDLEIRSVIIRDLIRTTTDKGKFVKTEISVAYLEYCTTSKTWENDNISRIFSLDDNQRQTEPYQPFSVDVVCEICLEREEAKLLVQSEVHLSNFLRKNVNKLLYLLLEQGTSV